MYTTKAPRVAQIFAAASSLQHGHARVENRAPWAMTAFQVPPIPIPTLCLSMLRLPHAKKHPCHLLCTEHTAPSTCSPQKEHMSLKPRRGERSKQRGPTRQRDADASNDLRDLRERNRNNSNSFCVKAVKWLYNIMVSHTYLEKKICSKCWPVSIQCIYIYKDSRRFLVFFLQCRPSLSM